MSTDQEEVEETNGKKGKKVYLPFGTSDNNSFSKFAHLAGSPETLSFATILSPPNTEIVRAPKDIKQRAVVEKDDSLLKSLNADDEYAKPCQRLDCIAVVKSLLESQSRNTNEKLFIQDELQRLALELEEIEQQNAQLDDRLSVLQGQDDSFQITIDQLDDQNKLLDKQRESLQQERDGFQGKIMVTETEKQTQARALVLAQKALADAMWKGSNNIEKKHTISMVIKRDVMSAKESDEISITSYDKLAGDYVMDSVERPKVVDSIPYFIRAALSRSDDFDDLSTIDSKSVTSRARSSKSSLSPSSSHKSILSRSLTVNGRLSPISITRKSLEQTLSKVRASSPHLQMSGESFKGYTPTGLPSAKIRSSMKKDSSSSPSSSNRHSGVFFNESDNYSINSASTFGRSVFDDDNNSKICSPIFSDERARTAFGRTKVVGKVRCVGMQNIGLNTTLNKSLTSPF